MFLKRKTTTLKSSPTFLPFIPFKAVFHDLGIRSTTGTSAPRGRNTLVVLRRFRQPGVINQMQAA